MLRNWPYSLHHITQSQCLWYCVAFSVHLIINTVYGMSETLLCNRVRNSKMQIHNRTVSIIIFVSRFCGFWHLSDMASFSKHSTLKYPFLQNPQRYYISYMSIFFHDQFSFREQKRSDIWLLNKPFTRYTVLSKAALMVPEQNQYWPSQYLSVRFRCSVPRFLNRAFTISNYNIQLCS